MEVIFCLPASNLLIMIICKNCGVELDQDMDFCPLCNEPVMNSSNEIVANENHHKEHERDKNNKPERKMSQPQRKATWEMVFLILVLISIITSLLNYILNKEISWSQYPVAVCMIIFSYISFLTFLNAKIEFKFFLGFMSASVLILILDLFTSKNWWSIRLAIPILLSINIITITLLEVIKFSKQRGINIISYSFLAAALLCISCEAITDLYIYKQINLVWSLIVSACVLPISLVLLFMQYKLKKGSDLNKTFHI